MSKLGENRFAEARNKSIVDIIRHYNIDITQNGYLHCPFCSSNRKYNSGVSENKFKCFHCGVNASTIDFVSKIENINAVEAVNILLDNSLSIKKYDPHAAVQKKHENDVVKNMVLKNSRLLSRCPEGMKYFEDRALTEALPLINRDQLRIKFNDYNGYKSIIYRFVKQDFVIQKGIEKNADGKRFVRNFGNTAPVPIKAYDHNKYMIVEGIEDGLTALILGYNFITLNSIQNAGRLMELLDQHEDWLKNNTFISCLDNDEGGNECTEKLKAYFFSKGLILRDSRYRRKMIKCNVKDLNQFYINLKQKEGDE